MNFSTIKEIILRCKNNVNFKLYSNILNDTDWRTMDTCPEYTDVYLKCHLMMDDFVVIGQVGDGARIKSDGDPDVFFRSAILFWKPLDK